MYFFVYDYAIFSQVLDIIEMFIKSQGWSFRRLDGSTNAKNRRHFVDEFNNTPVNIIVVKTNNQTQRYFIL
jgi:SNF2 family DNA or RNA helicase